MQSPALHSLTRWRSGGCRGSCHWVPQGAPPQQAGLQSSRGRGAGHLAIMAAFSGLGKAFWGGQGFRSVEENSAGPRAFGSPAILTRGKGSQLHTEWKPVQRVPPDQPRNKCAGTLLNYRVERFRLCCSVLVAMERVRGQAGAGRQQCKGTCGANGHRKVHPSTRGAHRRQQGSWKRIPHRAVHCAIPFSQSPLPW